MDYENLNYHQRSPGSTIHYLDTRGEHNISISIISISKIDYHLTPTINKYQNTWSPFRSIINVNVHAKKNYEKVKK